MATVRAPGSGRAASPRPTRPLHDGEHVQPVVRGLVVGGLAAVLGVGDVEQHGDAVRGVRPHPVLRAAPAGDGRAGQRADGRDQLVGRRPQAQRGGTADLARPAARPDRGADERADQPADDDVGEPHLGQLPGRRRQLGEQHRDDDGEAELGCGGPEQGPRGERDDHGDRQHDGVDDRVVADDRQHARGHERARRACRGTRDQGEPARDGRGAHERQRRQQHPEPVGEVEQVGGQAGGGEAQREPHGVLEVHRARVKWAASLRHHSSAVGMPRYQADAATAVVGSAGAPCRGHRTAKTSRGRRRRPRR